MHLVGGRLGRRIALALLGHHMDKDRSLALIVADIAQHRQQVFHVVTVNRPDIEEPHLFKQGTAGDQTTGIFLSPFGGVLDWTREACCQIEHVLAQITIWLG